MNLETLTTTEKNDKGNIVYSYSPVKSKEIFFKRIIIPQLPLILISIIAYSIVCKYFEEVSPIVILIIFLVTFFISSLILFYRRELYIEKLNDAREKEIISNAMKDIIKEDIASFGLNIIELERNFVVDTQEYGIVKEKYLILVLSNGIRLKYNINFISHYKKTLVQEINTKYEKM